MGGLAAYASQTGQENCMSTVLALMIELQHRGQEAAAIALADTKGCIKPWISRGLTLELINNNILSEGLFNNVFGAIGYTMYSTLGSRSHTGIQPIVYGNDEFKIALAFDGAIANYKILAKELNLNNNDSYIAVFAEAIHKLALEYGKDVVEALKQLSYMVIGGYSVAILTSEPRLVVARDPRGFKPLAYAFDDRKLIVSSESSALEVLGYNNWSEVGHGEILAFDGKSLELTHGAIETHTPCVFEYVYIARLDTIFNNINVYKVRVDLGHELARIAPVNADIIIPVPDSGRAAAIGYSRGSGIPLEEGLVINRYLGRGFIMPPPLRDIVAKLKYGFIRSSIYSRRIVLVDDSIVRGTTMAAIALRLKDLGAKEVHIRISCPPFKYPCFMGVDVASRKELLAWRNMNSKEIAQELNADSVAFNTIDSLVKAVGLKSLCLACFTGIYPFKDLSVDDLEAMYS